LNFPDCPSSRFQVRDRKSGDVDNGAEADAGVDRVIRRLSQLAAVRFAFPREVAGSGCLAP